MALQRRLLQSKVRHYLALLRADEIGITLSEEDQLDPEQSTSDHRRPPPADETLFGLTSVRSTGLPGETAAGDMKRARVRISMLLRCAACSRLAGSSCRDIPNATSAITPNEGSGEERNARDDLTRLRNLR